MDNILLEKKIKKIKYLSIGLANEDIIRSWSYGEVLNSDTINYKTNIPEFGGLFCQRIFGPVKDYLCSCKKYKGIQFQGIKCEICKVEVLSSQVRRYRMAHIELAVPVIHFWFIKIFPTLITSLLQISIVNIKKILQNEIYVIINSYISEYDNKSLISKNEVNLIKNEFGDKIEILTGIEAIYELLKRMNVEYLINKIRTRISLENTTCVKFFKSLQILDLFKKSNNSPSNLIIKVLPVLPPELRPLVMLEEGKYANSDLNLLYRNVINRNNRLKNLIKSGASCELIEHSKILLQESVNSLLDNESTHDPLNNTYTNKPLKSISNILKGKYGRFRSNLLGKRVDYSGRSVIVVGPNLDLHQCGLPIKMAKELFKPFVINKLLDKNFNLTIREATSMIESNHPIVYSLLLEIVKDYPILLNRAPTLHRLGIQAFYPILIKGNAIKLHPLVCTAFNADFDGDQMAVHIPLTNEAKLEAQKLMLSTKNLLSSSNSNPIIFPTQDSILGLFYLTRIFKTSNKLKYFYNIYDVKSYYDLGFISLNENIKIFFKPQSLGIITSVGRILLFYYLPKIINFELINQTLKKKNVVNLIKICYELYGLDQTIKITSILTKIGFRFSTISGLSISLDDINVKFNKNKIISDTFEYINQNVYNNSAVVLKNYTASSKIINIWNNVKDNIKFLIKKKIEEIKILNKNSLFANNFSFNNINLMIESGARGTIDQFLQLAGMRGLMSKPSGEVIKQPIISSFFTGMNSFDYFISTHGARKGLSDTALKTANSGYLTRRLVDVSQDIFITNIDCNTNNGLLISKFSNNLFEKNIFGRLLLEDLINPFTHLVILKKNTILFDNEINIIKNNKIFNLKIRSSLFCKNKKGICSYCYGIDLSTLKIVKLGESVGIIAAQSIGEPGTQLTMRTFHSGGANVLSSSSSFKKQIFSPCYGYCKFINFLCLKNKNNIKINIAYKSELIIYNEFGIQIDSINIPYGVKVYVNDYEYIIKNQLIAEFIKDQLCCFSFFNGFITIKNGYLGKNLKQKSVDLNEYIVINHHYYKLPYLEIFNKKKNIKYQLIENSVLTIRNGQKIYQGDIIYYIEKHNLKNVDITGGLVKIANSFEVRCKNISNSICLHSGIVSNKINFLAPQKVNFYSPFLNLKFCVENKNLYDKILPGTWVNRGDIFFIENLSLNTILKLHGLNFTINYFVKEIQSIYLSHGILVNNKHIEIIFYQMVKRSFLIDKYKNKLCKEYVDIKNLDIEQIKTLFCQTRIIFKRVVLGITKSSLLTDSFISAASFQETSKVLSQAAAFGKKDYLYGLKENVILGNLIPSGTGFIPDDN